MTQNKKKSTKRASARGKTERAALEAKVAELFAMCPRASAAMQVHCEVADRCGSDSPEARQAFRHAKKLLQAAIERSSPSAIRLPAYTPNDPREEPSVAERDQLHDEIFAGGVYSRLSKPMVEQVWGAESHVSKETAATNVLHAGDVLRQMNPRDPMEKMLIAQALWNHGRIAHLTELVALEKSYKGIRILNEAIDRAGNTFRRQMLALSEYRRPPQPGGTVNRINQANIANQQIVQNGRAEADAEPPASDPTEKNTTNELGLHDDNTAQERTRKASLPSQPHGQAIVAGRSEAQSALAPRDRAED